MVKQHDMKHYMGDEFEGVLSRLSHLETTVRKNVKDPETKKRLLKSIYKAEKGIDVALRILGEEVKGW